MSYFLPSQPKMSPPYCQFEEDEAQKLAGNCHQQQEMAGNCHQQQEMAGIFHQQQGIVGMDCSSGEPEETMKLPVKIADSAEIKRRLKAKALRGEPMSCGAPNVTVLENRNEEGQAKREIPFSIHYNMSRKF